MIDQFVIFTVGLAVGLAVGLGLARLKAYLDRRDAEADARARELEEQVLFLAHAIWARDHAESDKLPNTYTVH